MDMSGYVKYGYGQRIFKWSVNVYFDNIIYDSKSDNIKSVTQECNDVDFSIIIMSVMKNHTIVLMYQKVLAKIHQKFCPIPTLKNPPVIKLGL